MMRLFIMFFLTTLSALAFSQGRIHISGTANGLKDGTELIIYKVQPKFTKPVSEKIKILIEKGKFHFSADQSAAEYYYFELLKKKKYFFLDTGRFEINLPDALLTNATISYSMADLDYQDYLKSSDIPSRKIYGKALTEMDNFVSSKSQDVKQRDEILARINSTKKEYEKHAIDSALKWIANHPKSAINAFVLYQLSDFIPDSLLKSSFTKLNNHAKNNTWGKELNYKIDNTTIGAIAPNFEQIDTANKKVSLKSFRGKYLLIDFWATWCIPCLNDIPRLKKSKEILANHNFEIISISLDEKSNRLKWLDIIKKEGMDWVNLSSLNGFNNKIAKDYLIKAIPSSFLVAPDGRIIAKNISGLDLYRIVKEHSLQ